MVEIMAEAAPNTVNIGVVVGAVCGSVVIIAAIIVVVCVVGYCYDRFLRASDARSRPVESHQPHHHRRRRRRREHGHGEEGEGASEDVHPEDSELQPHPPPPSYSRVHQYSSIDVDLNEITQRRDSADQNGTVASVSMYIGDEEETVGDQDLGTNDNLNETVIHQVGPSQQDTLPPTYSTAQLELMAARSSTTTEEGSPGNNGRLAREADPEITSQTQSRSTGSLPPSYSTARMELMRVRAQNSTEQDLSNDDDS